MAVRIGTRLNAHGVIARTGKYRRAIAVGQGPGVSRRICDRATSRICAVVIDLNRVGKQVLSLAGVRDEVLLCQTADEGFRRQGSVVFDDALDAAVRVASAENYARVRKLMLE